MARLPTRLQRCAARRQLSGSGWSSRLVFELLVLTASRSSDVRLAIWGEMDIDARVWTIPAARLKTGREHRVPLCSRAVEIVDRARRLRADSTRVAPGGLVFPRRRGRAFHNATLSVLLKKLGIGAVPHGFRSSFGTGRRNGRTIRER